MQQVTESILSDDNESPGVVKNRQEETGSCCLLTN